MGCTACTCRSVDLWVGSTSTHAHGVTDYGRVCLWSGVDVDDGNGALLLVAFCKKLNTNSGVICTLTAYIDHGILQRLHSWPSGISGRSLQRTA